MIEDKTRPPRPTPRDWAVFRYGLISEAARPLAGQVVAQTLARIAARQHMLPDGSLRRFSTATLRGPPRSSPATASSTAPSPSSSSTRSFTTIACCPRERKSAKPHYDAS
jgi:hypothetical protein